MHDCLSKLPQSIQEDLEHFANLPDNWDEDGGKPYPRHQLERVAKWWVDFAAEYASEYAAPPPIPSLGHAEEQSIDLHWDGDFSLLVNIPEDPNEPCHYHGFNPKDEGSTVQGQQRLEALGKAIMATVREHCDQQ